MFPFKVKEARLRWYGHVRRADEKHPARKCIEGALPGVRGRGKPRTRWRDKIDQEMKELRLKEIDVTDRERWRKQIRATDLERLGNGP